MSVVVEVWLKVVDQMDQAILEQTRALERMAKEDVRARWLETVPGIGAYSAMVILAEVGEIERFQSRRALASYAGLTPSVRGRRAGGSALGSAIMGPERCAGSSAGGAGGGPLLARCTCLVSPAEAAKTSQVALIALARKLLTAVWALLRHGVCFDENAFAQQG